MTTTSLVTLSGAPLTELESAVLAELEAETSAYDYMPTRIKFPSGGMSVFSIDDADTLKPPFRAIIAVSQKARAWWPGKDTQGLPPICASPDGSVGVFNPNDVEQVKLAAMWPFRHPALDTLDREAASGPWPCSACPLSEWGSGTGRGQACKTLRRLIVLVEGWTMPAIMTLPPTSVRVFDQYASARARERGHAYFTAWTRIELAQQTNTAGIKYSVAKFVFDGTLTEGETAAVIGIRHQFSELVRQMGITAEDYETAEPAVNSNGSAVEETPPF